MRKLILVVAAAMMAAGGALQAASPGPYEPQADAAAQLRAAADQARAGQERILAVVGGNWCGWCRALDRLMHENAAIRDELAEHWVVVHINYSKENKNLPTMERLDRPDKLGFPALVVLTPGLDVVHLQESGVLEDKQAGGPAHDPAKVLDFLRKWESAPPDQR